MTDLNRAEKRLESKARRLAVSHGYVARKAGRYSPPNLCGGFAIFDPSMNVPVFGWRYELSAQDVIDWFRS